MLTCIYLSIYLSIHQTLHFMYHVREGWESLWKKHVWVGHNNHPFVWSQTEITLNVPVRISELIYIKVYFSLFLAHLSWKLKWAFLIDRCPASGCPFVCKLLHFRLLLQNYWANFNQTWHKSSLGRGDSSFVKKKGDSPSPRRDNSKRLKTHWKFLKIFFSRTCRPNSIKLGTNYPWMKGNQVCSNKEPCLLQRGDNRKNGVVSFKNLLLQSHWANFNQTWHKLSLGGGDSKGITILHEI
jgi:hypothetical protein